MVRVMIMVRVYNVIIDIAYYSFCLKAAIVSTEIVLSFKPFNKSTTLALRNFCLSFKRKDSTRK